MSDPTPAVVEWPMLHHNSGHLCVGSRVPVASLDAYGTCVDRATMCFAYYFAVLVSMGLLASCSGSSGDGATKSTTGTGEDRGSPQRRYSSTFRVTKRAPSKP